MKEKNLENEETKKNNMKKLLGIMVLGLFLSVNANSATTKFKTGSLHEGDFYWDHKKISITNYNHYWSNSSYFNINCTRILINNWMAIFIRLCGISIFSI